LPGKHQRFIVRRTSIEKIKLLCLKHLSLQHLNSHFQFAFLETIYAIY